MNTSLFVRQTADSWFRHVASPLPQSVRDVEKDLLQPAIRGTVNILKAATKAGTVQAVVITSSLGAMLDQRTHWRPGYTYTSVRIAFIQIGCFLMMYTGRLEPNHVRGSGEPKSRLQQVPAGPARAYHVLRL